MTNLHAAVDDYLSIRRHLGFSLERHGLLLPRFVDYLEAAGEERVTTAAALDWAMLPRDGRPAWWATRLGVVRGFARHLQAVDPVHEVPPERLLPSRRSRNRPYLYSDDDVSALMQAAGALTPAYRSAIYETLIGLLFVSGMRLGEVLGPDRVDVDLEQGVLTVRRAKFNKDREVPVHPSTVVALGRYAEVRDRH